MDVAKIETLANMNSFVRTGCPGRFELSKGDEQIVLEIKRKSVVAITTKPGRSPRVKSVLFKDMEPSFFRDLTG